MSLARSSFVFGIGTLISRFSGLLRDMVITHLLGASSLNDAFVVAQRIPNLLRDMLAEGALGSSFTKVYTALKEENASAAECLLFQMLYLVVIFTSLLVFLGMMFSPQLVNLMNLGVSDSYTLDPVTIELTRLLFPSLACAVIGAVAMGALYQKGRFFFNAVLPVVANIGVILGGFFSSHLLSRISWFDDLPTHLHGVYGLAFGTLLGFIVQTSFSVWAIRKALQRVGRKWLFTIPWSFDIKKVVVLMGPAAIAGSAGPINSLVNTNFATSIGEGAVTWLAYAFRLVQLPIGIFGVAVGVYALPALTRAVIRAGKKIDENVSQELQDSCVFVVWLLTPCMVFTLCFSEEIIDLIFGHGKYTASDVKATASALFAYSISMLAYGLIKVFTSFYYSIDKTAFAMKVSLGGIATNFIMNMLMTQKWGHVGLATSTTITLTLNALLLLWGTTRQGVSWKWPSIAKNFLILLSGSLVFWSANVQLSKVVSYLFEGLSGKLGKLLSSEFVDPSVFSQIINLSSGFVLLVLTFGLHWYLLYLTNKRSKS